MKKFLAFVWLFVVVGACFYLSARVYSGINFRADIMALVPREEQNASLAKANDSVIRSLSKKVIFLIGHKNQDEARAAAVEISSSLSASGLVNFGNGLVSDKFRKLGALYFPYRYGLLSDQDRLLLQEEKAQEIVDNSLSQIFSIANMSNASLLKTDPFLLMPRFLTSLPIPLTRLSLNDGLLTLTDNGTTWVLVSGALNGEPYALDMQKKFDEKVSNIILSQKNIHENLEVLRTGAVFFAKDGATMAMQETTLIGVVSLIGTVLLLIASFRSLFPLLMSLMVVFTGMLVALSFSLWFWQEIHICALLFGVSLIGVSVDYSLQYCSEIFVVDCIKPKMRLKNVWAAIALGAATTIIGYLTLLLAPFPGLRQIALFSAVGLFASFLSVVLWFPFLDKMKPRSQAVPFALYINYFLSFWEKQAFCFRRLCLFGFLCILCFFGALSFNVDDDVRKLQSLSPLLVSEQMRIQNLIGTTVGNQFIVVQGESDEAILQKEELLQTSLDVYKKLGVIKDYQSLARFVPSLARQAENRHMVVDLLYKPFLSQQLSAIGLSILPQVPEEKADGLTLAAAEVSLNDMGVLSLLRPENATGLLHVITLSGVSDNEKIFELCAKQTGVFFVDPVRDYTQLFAKYRARAIYLTIFSAFLMLPLLLWRYGIVKAVKVMLPAVLSTLMTPAICALTGAVFTFFDAIALVLVLSIGIDYTVFYIETTEKRKMVTMFAVLMSACATIMSFGFLSFSQVLAVYNFGLTMFVGVLLNLLLVPMCRSANIANLFNVMKYVQKTVPVFLFILLTGCAAQKAEVNSNVHATAAVYMAPNVSLEMPSFFDLDKPINVLQNVVATYDGQSFVFEGRIQASADYFKMVCVDAFGRRFLTIDWTKAGISYEAAPWVPAQLKPQNILADIIFLYWPEKIVSRSLQQPVIFKQTKDARLAYIDEKEILHADYVDILSDNIWSGSVAYKNLAWNYSLNIQTIALSP